MKKSTRCTTATSSKRSPAKPKTVYLIRHGKSLGQDAKKHGVDRHHDMRLQDCGLSRQGISQALHLAEKMKELPPAEVVISSPLTRALETAILGFQSTGTPIVLHYGLREIGSSIPENIPRASIQQTLRYIESHHMIDETYLQSKIDYQSLQPSHWPHSEDNLDGTNRRQFKAERIRNIFHWMYNERNESIMTVVCHYNVIRAALTTPGIRPINATPIPCRLYEDGTLEPIT